MLADLKVERDFEYSRPEADTELMFVHRKLPSGEIYFVDNRKDRVENLDVTFRVEGKTPELWHADTGKTEPVSYRMVDGRTTIPLHLDPNDAVFVLFRKPTSNTNLSLPALAEDIVATVDGLWSVNFQPDLGVSAKINIEKLTSWSDSSNQGVKYFSGTATYTKTIHAKGEWFKANTHLWLDLGSVKELTDVTLNGKPLGMVWKAPYRVDTRSALRRGDNRLTIKVTNLWVNRLIGDQQPNISTKYTFTTFKPYRADSPLLPSGLLGPVQLLSVTPK